MPLPALIGTGLSLLPTLTSLFKRKTTGILPAAAAAGESIFNVISQNRANKQARDFALDQMHKQREWALSDWNAQNAYNNPAAQMERFKQAGLNPNLIYGSTNVAAPVRSTDTATFKPQAPQISGITQSLSQIYDLQKVQAQTDNIRAQTDFLAKREDLMKLQGANLQSNTERTNWLTKFGQDKSLMELEALRLGNLNLEAGIQTKLDANARAWALQSPKIDEIAQRIAYSKAMASKVPYEKAVMMANARLISSKNHWLNLTEPQKIQMGTLLQQSELIGQMLSGRKIAELEGKIELNKIAQKWREMGMSETTITDVLKILGGAAIIAAKPQSRRKP